jgi:hypothetical protein
MTFNDALTLFEYYNVICIVNITIETIGVARAGAETNTYTALFWRAIIKHRTASEN